MHVLVAWCMREYCMSACVMRVSHACSASCVRPWCLRVSYVLSGRKHGVRPLWGGWGLRVGRGVFGCVT